MPRRKPLFSRRIGKFAWDRHASCTAADHLPRCSRGGCGSKEHPEHNPWAPLDLRDPTGWATAMKLRAAQGRCRSVPIRSGALRRSLHRAASRRRQGMRAARPDQAGSLPVRAFGAAHHLCRRNRARAVAARYTRSRGAGHLRQRRRARRTSRSLFVPPHVWPRPRAVERARDRKRHRYRRRGPEGRHAHQRAQRTGMARMTRPASFIASATVPAARFRPCSAPTTTPRTAITCIST